MLDESGLQQLNGSSSLIENGEDHHWYSIKLPTDDVTDSIVIVANLKPGTTLRFDANAWPV